MNLWVAWVRVKKKTQEETDEEDIKVGTVREMWCPLDSIPNDATALLLPGSSEWNRLAYIRNGEVFSRLRVLGPGTQPLHRRRGSLHDNVQYIPGTAMQM